MGIVTGEEACPGGSAGGSGDEAIVKGDALPDQTIHVRSVHMSISQGGNGIEPLLVGNDEYDIGLLLHEYLKNPLEGNGNGFLRMEGNSKTHTPVRFQNRRDP